MPDRLPPLTALRAFDAAARHMSFAKAAAELNVTPAALSFQIKSLEEHLGQPLFNRLNRAVSLTEAGRTLAPGAADGFAALTRAWRAARNLHNNHPLIVTAGPAFTAKWLAARLYDFARANPEIELRFSASITYVDLTRDEVDVALRFTSHPSPGLFCHTLFREWMTPMMSPEIAARCTSPEMLVNEILLHQDDIVLTNPDIGWAQWMHHQGLHAPAPGGPRFSQSDHAIDAAISGAGVVLGRISLAQHALRSGQLVAPFPLALQNQTECRFLCAKGQETRPDIKTFFDWIKTEVAAMEHLAEGRHFVEIRP
ncbi:transcriptional regulator GcvA [Actibacterium sp. XHP0104]|uniref:transcriptional regulator GcvA n=1 Tax=Actibacterium sp. XHP0104 TaxID=2984335 RepID=UPI0021E70250|nr:transcriptional regulator GcvA [Actibacterium sp. XHP0104]MCV2883048.1 transcriptional regulator GcvA [Actibacterium sp. XHP0104]